MKKIVAVLCSVLLCVQPVYAMQVREPILYTDTGRRGNTGGGKRTGGSRDRYAGGSGRAGGNRGSGRTNRRRERRELGGKRAVCGFDGSLYWAGDL